MGSRAADAVTVEDWRRYTLSLALPPSSRRWPLPEAQGCTLTERLQTLHPLPPFDSSAMDGYAVRAADVAGACQERPVHLAVIGSAPAGSPTDAALASGHAVRILTGGMLPRGADAVVPVEGTDAGRETVAIWVPVPAGRHIRRMGEDAPAGTVIASPGAHIGPGLLAAAAAAGHAELLVLPPPRVLVISTGDELAPPGAALGAGLIPDSNGVGVAAATRALGARVHAVARCPDVPDQLRSLVYEHIDCVDLVVTTGGISAGAENDVVPERRTTWCGRHSKVRARCASRRWRCGQAPPRPPDRSAADRFWGCRAIRWRPPSPSRSSCDPCCDGCAG